MNNYFRKYKPSVSRRTLLLVAACAWTIAGTILLVRGLIYLLPNSHHLFPELLLGILLGIVFFIILFSRISLKHIMRIKTIKTDDPCFFSFFNMKSYLMMAVMITAGVTIRKMGIIDPEAIYTFFIIMAIPLLMSAFRFYKSWYINKS